MAFDSRDPEARPWVQWTASERERLETPDGPVETWLSVTEVQADRVRIVGHNRFLETGDVLDSESVLRFRTHAELRRSLGQAGFELSQIYGDWQRRPFREGDPVMIFVAQRPGSVYGLDTPCIPR